MWKQPSALTAREKVRKRHGGTSDRSYPEARQAEAGPDQTRRRYRLLQGPAEGQQSLHLEAQGSQNGSNTLYDPEIALFNKNGSIIDIVDNFNGRDPLIQGRRI
jgi:hypothetical protein